MTEQQQERGAFTVRYQAVQSLFALGTLYDTVIHGDRPSGMAMQETIQNSMPQDGAMESDPTQQ